MNALISLIIIILVAVILYRLKPKSKFANILWGWRFAVSLILTLITLTILTL
jgi:hypothetical protein